MTRIVSPPRRNHRRVQTPVDQAENSQPHLAVILPRVLDADRAVEAHVREPLESDPARPDVYCTLRRIEFDQWHYIVSTIKWNEFAASAPSEARRHSHPPGEGSPCLELCVLRQ